MLALSAAEKKFKINQPIFFIDNAFFLLKIISALASWSVSAGSIPFYLKTQTRVSTDPSNYLNFYMINKLYE